MLHLLHNKDSYRIPIQNEHEIKLCTNCKTAACIASDPNECFNVFTKDDVKPAVNMLKHGVTKAKVAKRYGIKSHHLQKILEDLGYSDILSEKRVRGSIDKDLVYEMYKKYKNIEKVSEVMGYHKCTIITALSKNADYIKNCKINRNRKKINVVQAFDLYKKHGNMKKVAKIIGCGWATVSRRLNKYKPYLDWRDGKK